MKGVMALKMNENDLKTSAMYIAYLILSGMKKKKKDRLSIYDISDILQKKNVSSSRQLVIGLLFLYSVDIIDFEEATIWIKKSIE